MVLVLPPSTDFNFALNQSAIGTGTADGSNVVSNLVDGDVESRWSVEIFPHSVTVDLLEEVRITQTELVCFQDRAYQFIIEGALDLEGPYTTIVDRTRNRMAGTELTPIINSIDSLAYRFVRITVMGADVYTGPWTSLTELRIFGEGNRLTSVEDENDANVRLSPNPASSIVTIEGAEEYNTITVYDQSGRRVMEQSINNTSTLDISQLRSGIYLVKFEGDDKRHLTKLVKQ